MAKPLHLISGVITEVTANTTSAGAGDAGKLVALDAGGKLDSTLLPPGLGADSKTATAGESLTAGDLVYIDSAGEVMKATGASSGHPAIGFVLESVSSEATVTVYFEGTNDELTSLTEGARYYLDGTTAGAITATPVTGTGKIHQFVGVAISETELSFEASDHIVLA